MASVTVDSLELTTTSFQAKDNMVNTPTQQPHPKSKPLNQKTLKSKPLPAISQFKPQPWLYDRFCHSTNEGSWKCKGRQRQKCKGSYGGAKPNCGQSLGPVDVEIIEPS
ncbi:hypothetical protein M0R45_030238 [Rubus argutus]|uniref:Uncharacterized protein n=1 Tax=Rubus argutus TaxID=59490 RepID=A0AAW1WCY5_RUBAR